MKGESSPLLPVTKRASNGKRRWNYCKHSSFCIQSRPGRRILLWIFAVLLTSLTYKTLYSLELLFEQFSFASSAPIIVNSGFIVISIVSSVTGLLKWSHYKAVLYSSRVITIMLLVICCNNFVTKYEFLQLKAVRNSVLIVQFTLIFCSLLSSSSLMPSSLVWINFTMPPL